jgi:murein DD-endopeptidase MepM/ murein hydrolase activator NlpD
VIKQPEPETTLSNGQPEGDIDDGFIWPFPKGVGRVLQGLHADQAYDFAAPKGTPIYAVYSGTVLISHPTGYNGGYGLYVVINFDDGRQAIFGHMSKVVAKVGQVVKKGDIIGYVGSTGKSTGPHLHLGFHGELRNPYIGLKVNARDFIINE